MEDQPKEEEIPKEEQKQEENIEEQKPEENNEEKKPEEKIEEPKVEEKKEEIKNNDLAENKIEIEENQEEKERLEKERLENERLEKERLEKERLEKLKAEQSKKTFEKCLWNKFEYMHKRYKTKIECFENTIDIFTRLMNSLKDHHKAVNTIISKNYNLFPGAEYSQTAALNMLKKGLDLEFNQINSSLDLLKKTLIEQLKKHKEEVKVKEKDTYNQFIKILNKYNDSKVVLEKNKNKYHQSLKVAQIALNNSKSMKVKNIDNSSDSKNTIQKLEDKAKELLNEAKKNYDKYINCIKETNKSREESIEKQKNFWKIIQSLEEKDGEFIVNLLKSYFNRLQDENETKKKFLEEMDTAINDIDLKKDKISLINLYKSNEKPDEVIELIQYEPQIDFENASNPEEFRINHEIIKWI